MIVLSIAGLIVSVSGVVVGWRYLRHKRPPRRRQDRLDRNPQAAAAADA